LICSFIYGIKEKSTGENRPDRNPQSAQCVLRVFALGAGWKRGAGCSGKDTDTDTGRAAGCSAGYGSADGGAVMAAFCPRTKEDEGD